MNLQFITRAIAAGRLAAKAHAPTLMVVGGVASMGAGTVVACKKTLEVEKVLEKHTADLEKVQEGVSLELASYPPETARKDRFKIYTRASWDLTRHYAVPGILFAGGAALVFGGHRIMLQRNATLAVSFTVLKEAFDKYRARVVAEQGSEADQRYYNGHVVKTVVDPETGEKAVITTRDWNESAHDPYNRVFEQGATSQWVPDLGINKGFVHNQNRFAQERLLREGILYLSDVYKALGFPETDISRVVGWKVKRLPDGSKDIPVVDFGLDKPHPDDWKYLSLIHI